MSDGEYHVASFVVTARPENATVVGAQIAAVEGLEVHAEERGKFVVTAEAASVRALADLAAKIEAVDAVVAVAPIYHEYDGGVANPAADERVDNNDPTIANLRQ